MNDVIVFFSLEEVIVRVGTIETNLRTVAFGGGDAEDDV